MSTFPLTVTAQGDVYNTRLSLEHLHTPLSVPLNRIVWLNGTDNPLNSFYYISKIINNGCAGDSGIHKQIRSIMMFYFTTGSAKMETTITTVVLHADWYL